MRLVLIHQSPEPFTMTLPQHIDRRALVLELSDEGVYSVWIDLDKQDEIWDAALVELRKVANNAYVRQS